MNKTAREYVRRRDFRAFLLIAVAVVMATATAAVMADSFGRVRYDPRSNQLIATMIYDGTNPNHRFSIQWGRCRKLDQPLAAGPNGSPLEQPAHQIDVTILDNQGNDAARKRYVKTVTVPLAALSCRPARVTLWTEPVVHGLGSITLDVP